jgi:hypothetical protein
MSFSKYIILSVFIMLVVIFTASCRCICKSSRIIIGKKAPEIRTEKEIIGQLDSNPPPRVSNFDARVGFLTVGLKRIGIFGWKNLNYNAIANGEVVQCKKSNDGFLTVDLKVNKLTINGESFKIDQLKYLRAEICLAMIKLDNYPNIHDQVEVSGALMWDGDGFMEIHPAKSTDLLIPR